MLTFNAFSRNVNTINLKNIFTHGAVYKFERELNKLSVEK